MPVWASAPPTVTATVTVTVTVPPPPKKIKIKNRIKAAALNAAAWAARVAGGHPAGAHELLARYGHDHIGELRAR